MSGSPKMTLTFIVGGLRRRSRRMSGLRMDGSSGLGRLTLVTRAGHIEVSNEDGV